MRIIFLTTIIIFSSLAFSQSLLPRQTGSLPTDLSEVSGMEQAGDGKLWMHNDSGNEPVLFQTDSTGQIFRRVRLRVANTDWEDLARDDQGNIYVADLGNNGNSRQNLRIFRINASDLAVQDTLGADTISIRYKEQSAFPPGSRQLHFDVEALLWASDSLHIFTKNRTNPFDGWVYHYRFPDQPGNYTVARVDSFFTGGNLKESYWVTAADLSPDGERMVLLSSDKMWVFACYPGRDFFKGYGLEVGLFVLTQKEGLVFVDNRRLFMADERFLVTGGKVYQADISGLPTIKVELGPDRMLAGDSVVLSPSMPAGTRFRWSTGDSSASLTVDKPGKYAVEVNLNGCIARDSVTVMGPDSRVEEEAPLHIALGPNPFSRQINVQVNLPVAGPVEASLLDSAGKLVFRENKIFVRAGEQQFELMPTQLPPGNYQLVLRQNSYRVSGKLVKNN
ncbi:MAG: T9SS type A sorting domain-containing protein [Bacteroidia bacterium]